MSSVPGDNYGMPPRPSLNRLLDQALASGQKNPFGPTDSLAMSGLGASQPQNLSMIPQGAQIANVAPMAQPQFAAPMQAQQLQQGPAPSMFAQAPQQQPMQQAPQMRNSLLGYLTNRR